MIGKFFTWLADYILSLFQAKADQRAIDTDKKTLEEKVAETKPILDNIEELKAQQNAKSGEIATLTDKAKVADEAVKDAETESTRAIDRIRQIKKPKGITQDELASKLDKLNLDDTP